jgi:hypothetical protein
VIRRRDPRDGESDDASSGSESESESESEWEPTIAMGSEFRFEGGIYNVIGLDRTASTVTAKCRFPLTDAGGIMNLSLANVTQYLRDWLRP